MYGDAFQDLHRQSIELRRDLYGVRPCVLRGILSMLIEAQQAFIELRC